MSRYVAMVARLRCRGYARHAAVEAVAAAYGLDRATFRRLVAIVGRS